jgi:hypothetical protein
MKERALRCWTLGGERITEDVYSQINKGACMKSKLIAAIILAGVGAGLGAAGGEQTFTGVVSDTMCGKQHMMKNESPAQCTRECVKSGQADYALLVGDKMYKLKGDKSAIDKYAGEKATVKGTEKGDTITVSSISASKK